MSERDYWEMTDEERESLPLEHVSETETFVLWKINQGRRLERMAARDPGFEATRAEPVAADVEDCNYYDVIASLLFAAREHGYDPQTLCQDAIDQVDSFTEEAREDARQMRGPSATWSSGNPGQGGAECPGSQA